MASWKPWRALREQPQITFALVTMPPGCGDAVLATDGNNTVILVDRNVDPARRLCLLAHELVHHERGGSGHQPDLPPLLDTLVEREEARVNRIVAERLIPADELAAFCAARADMGEPVHAWEVAEHWGVDTDTARRAVHAARSAA